MALRRMSMPFRRLASLADRSRAVRLRRMSDMTFFWHDYETFGRVPRRDRPAQFAGVRTDADLNEIGEPVMVYCQPAPDYLPDPESCLLTGILPQQCMAQGLPEHAFADVIEKALAQPGTVGVGYNSIRFDDEVTRHLFWRNSSTRMHAMAEPCGRWDLLDVVRICWALRPDGIEWPKHEDGRPSFKLEHLTKANGLAHEAAHDALSDVRATIAMARLISNASRACGTSACACARKTRWCARWASATLPACFRHVRGGTWGHRAGVATRAAPHQQERGGGVGPGGRPHRAFHAQRRGHPPAHVQQGRRPPRRRGAPADQDAAHQQVAHRGGQLQGLRRGAGREVGHGHRAIAATCGVAAQKGELLAGMWPAVFERPAPQGTPDVDEDLYGGFIGNEDRRSLTRLRGLSPSQLADKRPAFADKRLDELLFRYRARNFPATLTDAERTQWLEHCAHRLHDGAGGALTLEAYFERIDVLEQNADERGQEILGALVDYATEIAPERD